MLNLRGCDIPIYQFSCVKCNHVFELSKKIMEPNPECPLCKSKTQIDIVTTPVVHLRGPGWHNAEYDKFGRHEYATKKKGK